MSDSRCSVRRSAWPACHSLLRLCVAALCAAVPSAHAGFVTLNQAGLDTIFSQTPVQDGGPPPTGPLGISVRFNPTITVDDPSLLTINTEDELNNLFAVGGSNAPTVDLFFVDAINECGGIELPPAIGCGEQNGNHIAIESGFAAQQGSAGNPGLGAILIAHELGHNLGLPHTVDASNLMNATLNGGFALTTEQAGVILNSSLLQRDQTTNALFLSVTPFAIVPEPAVTIFAGAGILSLLLLVRRRISA